MIALAVATLLVFFSEPAQGARRGEQAKSADAFVNSIGVNTHINHINSAYYSRYTVVRDRLADTGIRHARDAAVIWNDAELESLMYSRYREVASRGTRFTLHLDPRYQNQQTIDRTKIAQIAQKAGGALEAFEGPNELDLSGDPNWAAKLRPYQQALYGAVKGNSSTATMPVVGPSLARGASYNALGNLEAYFDYGNQHYYPNEWNPGGSGLDTWAMPHTRKVSPTKPLIATETGYHTATQWTGIGNKGVSESAMGKYIPRAFLEYFNRGFSRTYSYELIDYFPDPERDFWIWNYGLLRNDGSPKPAYGALKNLIDLLEDPGPSFAPQSLAYSLRGGGRNVHHTLLQKRDGRYYLVLWQEVPSYSSTTNTDISVPARQVTLRIRRQPMVTATTYLPNTSTNPTAVYANPERLTLWVPDHPLVVELKPNTAPSITSLAPSPDTSTSDRTPAIEATITDAQTDLSKANIRLEVDGRTIASTSFAYDTVTDRLAYTPSLAPGRHKVKIRATDPQGLRTDRVWYFRVL